MILVKVKAGIATASQGIIMRLYMKDVVSSKMKDVVSSKMKDAVSSKIESVLSWSLSS